ncbi:MarR family winged helix-turn-helix transcriptional regulator [Bergeyella sp. RCAD1439]|uniref:MarR family winged helix-turn-helix transcriptional regulator n=1 Tax=Bergeyella anatis TaxID=3113737 RepID=UPI002E16F015|nr:MarR family transcriptional regulator [Bergeyella sp. RCAD1439]
MSSEKLKLSNQFCFPVYALAKEMVHLYRPLLDDLDLTYPQYLVMLTLWESPNLSVTQIGEKLSLDSGTLTPLLKRLEQKELLTRNRLASDERVVEIRLTAKGLQLENKAEKVPEKLLESLNVNLEELKTLKTIICKILN